MSGDSADHSPVETIDLCSTSTDTVFVFPPCWTALGRSGEIETTPPRLGARLNSCRTLGAQSERLPGQGIREELMVQPKPVSEVPFEFRGATRPLPRVGERVAAGGSKLAGGRNAEPPPTVRVTATPMYHCNHCANDGRSGRRDEHPGSPVHPPRASRHQDGQSNVGRLSPGSRRRLHFSYAPGRPRPTAAFGEHRPGRGHEEGVRCLETSASPHLRRPTTGRTLLSAHGSSSGGCRPRSSKRSRPSSLSSRDSRNARPRRWMSAR